MDYEKKYKEALKDMRAIYPNLKGDAKLAVEHAFPELRESEDERHRKWILEYLYDGLRKADEQFKGQFNAAIAYLEKQNEPIDPFDTKLFKDGVKEGRRLEREDMEKEQKPILGVFGFKVGDAVRLKDGDGRKHIIKSFEEVEGLHGPNFYHVEFEDNSARSGIYTGEEYPNGYYTQMEKFEEEQKPAPKTCLKGIFDFDDISQLELAVDCYEEKKGRAYPVTVKHQHEVLMKLYDLIGIDREALDQDKDDETD